MMRKNATTGSVCKLHRVRLAVFTALLAMLALSLPVAADAEYDSSLNYYKDGAYVSTDSDGTDDASISYQSFSGGVWSGWTIVNGESFALAGGHANAANLNMGTYAQVISTPSNNNFSDAKMYTGASNRLTILPGSSGLALGDTTTLTLKIRLDGSLHTEAISWPGASWSHASMDAGLSVHDYAIQIDMGEDGSWSPTQASFGASCELESYDVYTPYWGYSYSSNWEKSWQTSSNISTGDYYGTSDGVKQYGESFHYEDGFYFNTGELILTFEAIVGHTLDFDAYMYLYVNANNDASAWADFNNTFAIDVTPTVEGISLDWQAVPEPTALSLLAIGTILLRRRKK